MSNQNMPIESGLIGGVMIMKGVGERESMDVTATGEDIWRGNELNPLPTSHIQIPIPSPSGEQMSIVSESPGDALDGTGVRKVKFYYIKAEDGQEHIEEIELDGTNPVDFVVPDPRFINDMYSISVGSHGVAEGNIKIHNKADPGLVYNMIYIGTNKSKVPAKMVPDGYNLILKGWHCEESQGKRVAFRIRSTSMNGVLLPGVFCFDDTAYIKGTASGMLELNEVVPGLGVVKITGFPDTGGGVGAEGSCSWHGELHPAVR